jgi:hypothetical protein
MVWGIKNRRMGSGGGELDLDGGSGEVHLGGGGGGEELLACGLKEKWAQASGLGGNINLTRNLILTITLSSIMITKLPSYSYTTFKYTTILPR